MTVAGDETNRPLVGIAFIVFGMSSISINDMLVKLLSDDYSLHQIVLIRSLFGVTISAVALALRSGWRAFRTDRPTAHALRGILLVICNLAFFTAIVAMPIGEATALFFAAPLIISLLSVPLLGEKVGPRRLLAVLVGFGGVIIMLPLRDEDTLSLWVALLPIGAAFTYALFQIMTRRLGGTTTAGAMAVYVQFCLLVASSGFGLAFGHGEYAEGLEDPSLLFLFRAWFWPPLEDWPTFVCLGLLSAILAYALSQAYRSAAAATVAPFEYVALPLAAMWGFLIWRDIPDQADLLGMGLIIASGLYVLARERRERRLRRKAEAEG